ncbi:MAG: DUF1844 domain-containing protein [Acidobacteria bacterium]|nr:DUF1844 domain-containing protein [Acidobacteriota bacterium]
MAEKEPEIVVNDRRKFTMAGDLREGAQAEEPKEKVTTPAAEQPRQEQAKVTEIPKPDAPEPAATQKPDEETAGAQGAEAGLPPGPTPEESAEVQRAFEVTADRLDTAIRANNLGAEHLPPMNFERLISSVYMTAMMQLGAGTPQGEKARVDLLGARQSIDMLRVIEDKTANNRTEDESKLLASALFELRMAFLEITQALSRQAAAKVAQQSPEGVPPAAGPKLVV